MAGAIANKFRLHSSGTAPETVAPQPFSLPFSGASVACCTKECSVPRRIIADVCSSITCCMLGCPFIELANHILKAETPWDAFQDCASQTPAVALTIRDVPRPHLTTFLLYCRCKVVARLYRSATQKEFFQRIGGGL